MAFEYKIVPALWWQLGKCLVWKVIGNQNLPLLLSTYEKHIIGVRPTVFEFWPKMAVIVDLFCCSFQVMLADVADIHTQTQQCSSIGEGWRHES